VKWLIIVLLKLTALIRKLHPVSGAVNLNDNVRGDNPGNIQRSFASGATLAPFRVSPAAGGHFYARAVFRAER
jgi:hypothetical protein